MIGQEKQPFNQPSSEYVSKLRTQYLKALEREDEIKTTGTYSFRLMIDTGLQGEIETLRDLMRKLGQTVSVNLAEQPPQPISPLSSLDVKMLSRDYQYALSAIQERPQSNLPIDTTAQYYERERILGDFFTNCEINYKDFLPPEPPSWRTRAWDGIKKLVNIRQPHS